MKLTLDSTVIRSSKVFSQEIDTDVVILDVNSGEYYGSDIVGKHIWNLIEQPVRVESICDSILNKFQAVDRATCEHDTLAFLEDLHEAKLLEIVPA